MGRPNTCVTGSGASLTSSVRPAPNTIIAHKIVIPIKAHVIIKQILTIFNTNIIAVVPLNTVIYKEGPTSAPKDWPPGG